MRLTPVNRIRPKLVEDMSGVPASLTACPREFDPVEGPYLTSLRVGIRDAA